MGWDAFTWEKIGYALIYTGDREQNFSFIDYYQKRDPQVIGPVYGFISGYKKGFLQKRLTIVELLVTQVPKKERSAFKKRVEEQAKQLGLDSYQYRSPRSMSMEILQGWSCLYGKLRGEKKFLVQDYGTPESCARTAQLVNWLLQMDPKTSIVWVSACTEDMLLEKIFPGGMVHVERCNDFWRLENGDLERMDASIFRDRYQAILAAERAKQEMLRMRREIENQYKLQQAIQLEAQGKNREALELYLPLAKEDVSQAAENAVRLLLYGEGLDDYADREKRAKEVARNANSPAAFMMLGDKELEWVESRTERAKTDESLKELVVISLKRASEYYAEAANLGSADGCYKAANLFLRYSFEHIETCNGHQVNYRSYSYTSHDAIPYIKMLYEKEASGENVELQLMMLSIQNRTICDIAKEEYRQKK